MILPTAWVVASIAPLLVASIIYRLVANYFNRGLNRYPGPWLAKFTKVWHRIDVGTNRHQQNLLELHRKWGDIVRIGPNTLSIASPDLLPHIFGVKNEFLKSDMYDVFAPRINGKPQISWVSVRDPQAHAQIKKPIASAYSLTTLTEYEPLVDDVTKKFMDRLEDVGKSTDGIKCDMAVWMRLYAFDVITYLTFSNTLGFIDAGCDIDDFTLSLDKNLDQLALLTTMPWTAYLVKHNPIIGMFVKNNTIFPAWAGKRVQERIDCRQNLQKNGESDLTQAPKDFLDRFLDAGRVEKLPGYDLPLIMKWSLTNVMGGSDTTAVGLRAILYYLLKSPQEKSKLLRELRSAHLHFPVSWKESQQLPYLGACIREALRLHPAIGLGLERTVPVSGLLLPDGYLLPAGTNVSMNPCVVNRDSVFGEDPDRFIPERWLQQSHEGASQYNERVAKMKRADLTFGGGSRTCPGQYVALLETYKLIPTLLLEFDIGLVNEAAEWTTINRWVVRQENIDCWLRRNK